MDGEGDFVNVGFMIIGSFQFSIKEILTLVALKHRPAISQLLTDWVRRGTASQCILNSGCFGSDIILCKYNWLISHRLSDKALI